MFWTMFSSIRTKLTIWYVGILAVFILAFAGLTYYALLRTLDRDLNGRLAEMGRNFAAALSAEQDDEADGNAIVETAAELRFRDYQFIIYSADGRVKASTADFDFAFDGREKYESFDDVNAGSKAVRLYRTRLEVDAETFHLFVFHSLDEQAAMRRQLGRIFLIGLPLTLLFAGLGGYYLARKSLEPVAEMSRQATRIGSKNLDERLTIKNERDELGQLAGVFNDLLSRLDASFEQQRRFMADASHELRTPLAIVRGESEVALSRKDRPAEDYRESLAVVQDESKRLTKIVDDLFTLARADAKQFGENFEPVYLDEIVAEAVRSIGVLARKKNVRIDIDSVAEMPMRGDESLLRRLFLNLLDNAVKYSRSGGKVTVECTSTAENYFVIIMDDGIGIAPEEQEHIFERFYRVDKARSRGAETETSGAGLGLAIAKWIAEIHGGKIKLVSSDNDGSVFMIEFARQIGNQQ